MQENRTYSVDKAISSQQNPPPSFPIVVMAVPAGETKAMAMLSNLNPLPSDLAVIVFEYGQPREDALTGRDNAGLAARLRKATNAQVQLAGEGMAVEKGTIFIVPAGAGIQISEERFVFSLTISAGTEPYLPDLLLAGLAYSWGHRVIAVLISDQTSAGFTGCRVVREEGGFAFLLADRQSSGDGPGAAGESGCIDGQLSPAQLAARLLSLVDYPVFADRLKKNMAADKTNPGRIYRLLLHKSGVNFSVYRQSDIVLRIVRRMALTKVNEPEAYVAWLETHEHEVSHLCQDLLTAEAGFLFEPALGQMLEKEVMPRILSGRKGLQPFRIWITGCSVGEMAFSIAMRISEYLEVRSPGLALQLFVTGLNRRAVERARAGVYEESSLYYVTPAQQKKFFVNKEGLYHVIKPIREMCIFATHLLMADPPFSHIDLIITDNVMAYLSDNERRNVSKSFHYALNAGGCLLVRSGTPAPGLRADLFAPVQHVSGIYVRKEVPVSSFFPATFTRALPNAEKEADKILMSSYVPPGMLVDEELRVVRFYGIASPYLKRPGDHPSLHLLKIVRDEILFELSELLGQVDRSRQPATREGIFLTDNEVGMAISIEVIPIFFAERKWRLIVIREKETPRHREGHSDGPSFSGEKDRRIAALEKELQRARHQLRSAHKLFNDTQESLQSLYEEVQTMNEELQSVNEELQSVNEELEAANEGLNLLAGRAEAVISVIPQPLVLIGNDGRIGLANGAFLTLFGLQRGQVEGTSLYAAGNGMLNLPGLRYRLQNMQATDILDFEIEGLFPGLGERLLSFHVVCLKGEPGRRPGILLLIADGGSITVNSEKGKGSVFTVTLPIGKRE